MISDEDLRWPENDAEIAAVLAAAPDYLRHEWMCDCAEHAVAVCEPLHCEAEYSMSATTPIEVKRDWLAGKADDGHLERAQYHGVFECYWGKSISLGAAILGAAWYPGSGISVAEDEHYAESMTYYANVREALGDVMRECLKAVTSMASDAVYNVQRDPDAASERGYCVCEDEKKWQKQHILSAWAKQGKVTSYGLSCMGVDREENQDAFLALPELGLYLVVDAMSSARAAAITSAVFEESIRLARRDGILDGALTKAAQAASAAIMQEAQGHTDRLVRGMGAQFAALLIDDDEMRVAWIGQCRCYRSRGMKTELLTEDDSLLGCDGPYDFGTVSEEEIVPITKLILGVDAEPVVHEGKLGNPLPGDIYLLCTDAVYDMYDEEAVYKRLDHARNETLARLASQLMADAEPMDDGTVLCIRIGLSPEGLLT